MTFGWVGVVSIGLLFPGGSVVCGAILDASTWPGMIENQADHMAFATASLVQWSRGRVGPDVTLLCVTPIFSMGMRARYYVCVFSL